MGSDSRIRTGGCLCGGVRYRLTGELRNVINCFCTQCQKTSGHHVAATQLPLSNFELVGDSTLRWYDSSADARRGFCSHCGGSLFWQKLEADSISIMAGTIDTPTYLKTTKNIFVEDKNDYHSLPSIS